MPKRLITYSLVRCTDEQRDEALNVGVVALDGEGRAAVQVATDLGRIARTLPHVSVSHLKQYLCALPDYFESQSNASPEWLAHLATEWGNGLRLGELKVVTASGTLRDAVAELARRHVDVEVVAPSQPSIAPHYRAATSMRVVNSVVGKLHRAGFEHDRDFDRDVMIYGRTRKEKQVPVWFPLRVGREILIDSMEVKGSDEPRTYDAARLIAAKAEEAMRANSYKVTVVMRSAPEHTELAGVVESLLRDEAEFHGRTPDVYSYDRLEEVVESLPRPQLSLLASEGRAQLRAAKKLPGPRGREAD